MVKREIMPVAWRSLVFLLLLIIVPGLLVLLLIELEVDPQPAEYDSAAIIASVLCFGIAALVGWAMLTRRSVELADDALLVRHSFYTLTVSKDEARDLKVEHLQSPDQLRIWIKTNGVAAFGYLSGWFRGPSGARMFCAVSQVPLFRLTLPAHPRCQVLALSCSPEMAAAIRAWAEH